MRNSAAAPRYTHPLQVELGRGGAAGGDPAPWGKKILESGRLGSHSSSASPPALLPLTQPGTSSTARGQGCLLLSGKPCLLRHTQSRTPREKVPRRDSPGHITAHLDHVKQALTEEKQSDCCRRP